MSELNNPAAAASTSHDSLTGVTASQHHTAFVQADHDALPNPHHANTNDPSAGEKAALVGTAGTPSATNKYVTNDDARNTDARTPITHSMASHTDEGALATLNTVNTAQIDNDAVTLAKMADLVTARILGRVTGGTGDPEALTGTQATTLLDVFTSTLKGLVPSSGGGTSNFLRADGTFASPGASSTNIKETEVDFGTGLYQRAKSFTITDADVSATSQLIVTHALNAATGKSQDENEMDALVCRPVAGTGQFTVYVESLFGSVAGAFKLHYLIG